MPNHVTNILKVTGPAKDVAAFRDKVYRLETAKEESWNHDEGDEYPVFDYNSTVPMPEELRDTTSPTPKEEAEIEKAKILFEKYGASNWYDWCVKFWSTKWGAYDAEELEDINDGLQFKFNTAWCIGIQWQATTNEMFPSLKFVNTWIDEGGGSGIFTTFMENGELQYEEKEIKDRDWKLEYDENFRSEYDFITDGKYKEVIERFIEEGECDYYDLTSDLLKKIKDEDLPLFTDFKWGNSIDIYEARLKKQPKQPPTRKINWKE